MSEEARPERTLPGGEVGEKGGKEGQIDLARGALLASGVEMVKELNSYLQKIDRLCYKISGDTGGIFRGGSDSERARGIFRWLWRATPRRYEQGGDFRLTRALDSQLGESERVGSVEWVESKKVGNCLGLTVLYNVLARRFGLEVGAAHLEDAFGLGPHVFTVLYMRGRTIDIENIFPDGFDYRGHRGAGDREEWGDRELIADIYYSAGNDLFASGRWELAIESYDRAIALHPGYTAAHLNKGIALVELGRIGEAGEWFR